MSDAIRIRRHTYILTKGGSLPRILCHTPMKKRYETELPPQYRLVRTIDATDKRFGLLLNLIALIPAALIIGVAWWLLPIEASGQFDLSTLATRLLVFAAAMFAYIILHELVHGIAYKLLTHRKLTFGLTATVAYCGVPDIFVYRSTALIALLAPFLLFSLVAGLAICFLSAPLDRFLAAVFLGLHVGGCVGDLYDTLLYLTRFRSPDTLMKDTGPAQYFYEPSDSAPSGQTG